MRGSEKIAFKFFALEAQVNESNAQVSLKHNVEFVLIGGRVF